MTSRYVERVEYFDKDDPYLECRRRRFFSKPTAIAALALALMPLCAHAGPCDSPEHRQFDFWLGDWTVHAADGKLAGTNRIERAYGGCVLHERYRTDRDYSGESLNTYDPSRKLWHQTWVDSSGLLLVLEGAFRDGRMVLQGQTRDLNGTVTQHRITWSRNADGSVRQHWESTNAKGAWETAFDGKYTRR